MFVCMPTLSLYSCYPHSLFTPHSHIFSLSPLLLSISSCTVPPLFFPFSFSLPSSPSPSLPLSHHLTSSLFSCVNVFSHFCGQPTFAWLHSVWATLSLVHVTKVTAYIHHTLHTLYWLCFCAILFNPSQTYVSCCKCCSTPLWPKSLCNFALFCSLQVLHSLFSCHPAVLPNRDNGENRPRGTDCHCHSECH